MGVSGAEQLVYAIKNLSVAGVKHIARNRLNANERLCRIDVDCSWVAYKLLGKNGNASKAGELVAEFLILLAKAGFVPTPICDPQNRHHSKRESTRRVAEKEKARIEAVTARLKLTALAQKRVGLQGDESEEAEKEMSRLDSLVKKYENVNAKPSLPCSFIQDLDISLQVMDAHEENEHECFVEKIKVASFQADSLIAKRYIDRKSHLIMSSDTDFMALIGGECVTVRGFKLSRGRGKKNKANANIETLEVGCCSQSTFDDILAVIPSEEKITKREATHPLFSEKDTRLRGLIAVIIGCDVFNGGIYGVRAGTVAKKMKI